MSQGKKLWEILYDTLLQKVWQDNFEVNSHWFDFLTNKDTSSNLYIRSNLSDIYIGQ
jgi:hypothetical protein